MDDSQDLLLGRLQYRFSSSWICPHSATIGHYLFGPSSTSNAATHHPSNGASSPYPETKSGRHSAAFGHVSVGCWWLLLQPLSLYSMSSMNLSFLVALDPLVVTSQPSGHTRLLPPALSHTRPLPSGSNHTRLPLI